MLEWRVLWSDGYCVEFPTLSLAVSWRDATDDGTTAQIQRRHADETWTDYTEAARRA